MSGDETEDELEPAVLFGVCIFTYCLHLSFFGNDYEGATILVLVSWWVAISGLLGIHLAFGQGAQKEARQHEHYYIGRLNTHSIARLTLKSLK